MQNPKLWEIINGMHKRFGRKLVAEAFQDYEESVTAYTPELVNAAVKRLRKSAKSLPTPEEVRLACREMQAYFDNKEPMLPSELVCQYRDPSESEASRLLCEKATEEDAQASRVQGWGTLCRWHYDVMYAKHFPGSLRQQFVDDMLTDARRDMSVQKIDRLKVGMTKIVKQVTVRDSVAISSHTGSGIAGHGGCE